MNEAVWTFVMVMIAVHVHMYALLSLLTFSIGNLAESVNLLGLLDLCI